MSEAEIAGVVVGVTEMVKNFGLPSKYCPTVAIILSVALCIYDGQQTGNSDYIGLAVRGIIIGATTTGIYSATGNMIKKSTISTYGNTTQETH